jgi:hypothetical protein
MIITGYRRSQTDRRVQYQIGSVRCQPRSVHETGLHGKNELDGAQFQGRHVAEIARSLGWVAGERGPAPEDMQKLTETTGGTVGQP